MSLDCCQAPACCQGRGGGEVVGAAVEGERRAEGSLASGTAARSDAGGGRGAVGKVRLGYVRVPDVIANRNFDTLLLLRLILFMYCFSLLSKVFKKIIFSRFTIDSRN